MEDLPELPEGMEEDLQAWFDYRTPDEVREVFREYARKAVLLERERCAVLCETHVVAQQTSVQGPFLQPHKSPFDHDGKMYAAAIRSSGGGEK